MKFVYPEFLYALFAIAIPILIHLFNFRKFKRVYFSNVSFLKEVKQETQSKAKLKHLLVLLSRILAIIFLVLAFAQPYLPSNSSSANIHNTVGIYIDNSFSMESVGENASLLDEAKLKATEIVRSYKKTDRFVICDNTFSPESQRLLGAEDAINKIENIQITPETRFITSSVLRLKDVLNEQEKSNPRVYLISDFQKSTTDIHHAVKDSIVPIFFVPVTAHEISNLFIDSCWFNSPTHVQFQQEQLSVQIRNNANKDLENIPLKLYVNDQLVSPASFSVKANDKTVVSLNFQNKTSGTQNGRIEIRDHPVTMDDDFFFSYQISNAIHVLEIKGQETGNELQAVYKTDSVFNFSSHHIAQLDYSLIKKSDLVILNNLPTISSGLAASIHHFVINGGSLVVLPSNDVDLEGYREFLALLTTDYYTQVDTSMSSIKNITHKHEVYQNVFEGQPKSNIQLPKIHQHYLLSGNKTAYETTILSFKNGDAALTEYKVEKGRVYLSTFSSQTNFSKHAIFVPTFYNIGLLSQPNYPSFYTIGNNETLEVDRVENERVFHVTGTDFDVIPKTQSTNFYTTIFLPQDIRQSGNYLLLGQNNQQIGLAFNYNRLESDLTCYTKEELKELITTLSLHAKLLDYEINSMGSAIQEINAGKKYWKLCIILGLLFLAAEIALIKLLK